MHLPYFVPEDTGYGYKPSPYLEVLGDLRKKVTIFSGISHPHVDGGHAAEKSFLTAAPHPGSGSFRNSISVDQLVAESVGSQTRISSLVLNTNFVASICIGSTAIAEPPTLPASAQDCQAAIDLTQSPQLLASSISECLIARKTTENGGTMMP